MDNFLDAFLESINDEIDSYYIEKETRVEYAKRRFKEKYKYDPKEKTIEVDGKKYKVDANLDKGQKGKNKNFTAQLYIRKYGRGPFAKKEYVARDKKVDKSDEKRETASSILTNRISLDDDFFKLKNDERRDAVLQHEIGHNNLHNMQYSDKDLKSKKILKKMQDEDKRVKKQERKNEKETVQKGIDKIFNQNKDAREWSNKHPLVKSGFKAAGNALLTANNIKEDLKDIKARKLRKSMYMDSSVKNKEGDPERIKLRESSMDKLKKHEKLDKATHANTSEFEADLYAANKTSEKAMRRGLRDVYRQTRKQMKKDAKKNQDAKDLLKANNIAGEADYNARAKVLKSKDKILTRKERENYR